MPASLLSLLLLTDRTTMSAPSNTPEELAEAFANLNAAVASTPPSHPDYDKLVRKESETEPR